MNTQRRAVTYCRVSTKEQVEEGNSLETQKKLCQEYALKNGYEIAEVFVEQGESAKTQNRTELQRLLRYCAEKKNGIKAVIAYKIDRISRNTDDYSQIRILLKRYGVEIKSTSEYFENTPAGRFMENIISNVAQFDNDVRTERCINGMRDAVRAGRYVWTAPIGYSNVKAGGKSTIAPNKMAPLVKKVFEQVATTRLTLEEIRNGIARTGLMKKVGKPISKSYFYDLLRNELYTGTIKKFGEIHQGEFEPIVSKEIFDQVQRRLRGRVQRSYEYNTENADFPLRRFVAHPMGRKLTGCWSKGRRSWYAYYRFMQPEMSIPKDEFELVYCIFMDSWKLAPEYYTALKQRLPSVYGYATTELHTERVNLEKKVTDLKEYRKEITLKNHKGIISDNVLRELLAENEADLEESNRLLLRCPQQKDDLDGLYAFSSAFLKNPSDIWLKVPFAVKLKLQRFEFPCGVVYDGKKFRTGEICSLFKYESVFLHSNSARVGSSKQITNPPTITNEAYWSNVEQEIRELATILKEAGDLYKPE